MIFKIKKQSKSIKSIKSIKRRLRLFSLFWRDKTKNLNSVLPIVVPKSASFFENLITKDYDIHV